MQCFKSLGKKWVTLSKVYWLDACCGLTWLSRTFDFFTSPVNRKGCPRPVTHRDRTLIPLYKRNTRLFVRERTNHTAWPRRSIFHFRYWPPPPHRARKVPRCRKNDRHTNNVPLWKCLHAKCSILHLCNLCVPPLYSMARAPSWMSERTENKGETLRYMRAAARPVNPYFTPSLRRPL